MANVQFPSRTSREYDLRDNVVPISQTIPPIDDVVDTTEELKNETKKGVIKVVNTLVNGVKKDIQKSITNMEAEGMTRNIVDGILQVPSVEGLTTELLGEGHKTLREYIRWNQVKTVAISIISYFKIRVYFAAPASILALIQNIMS